MQFKQALNKFDFFILTKLVVYNIKKAVENIKLQLQKY